MNIKTLIILCLLALSSCQSHRVDQIGSTSGTTGYASWYGPQFHGKTTASGEVYNMHENTAAHKTLPFGTQVKVTKISDGQSVVVIINDRGPFVRGRIVDLSYQAAKQIGLVQEGTAKVKIEVVQGQPKASLNSNLFYIQTAAFQSKQNAEYFLEELQEKYPEAPIKIEKKSGIFKVWVGPYEDEASAMTFSSKLKSRGYRSLLLRR